MRTFEVVGIDAPTADPLAPDGSSAGAEGGEKPPSDSDFVRNRITRIVRRSTPPNGRDAAGHRTAYRRGTYKVSWSAPDWCARRTARRSGAIRVWRSVALAICDDLLPVFLPLTFGRG